MLLFANRNFINQSDCFYLTAAQGHQQEQLYDDVVQEQSQEMTVAVKISEDINGSHYPDFSETSSEDLHAHVFTSKPKKGVFRKINYVVSRLLAVKL